MKGILTIPKISAGLQCAEMGNTTLGTCRRLRWKWHCRVRLLAPEPLSDYRT